MKKTVAILLAVLMIFAMGACTSDGGGNGSAAVVGTYTMKSMTVEGVTLELEDLQALLALSGLDLDDLKVEFKDNGDYTMTVPAGDSSETASGTWEADGNNISLTGEAGISEATLSGNTLTFSDDEMTMVFEK